jgi:preprotein translocase subunit YajC
MYVLIVLPQRRRQAAHRRVLEQLELGDEIITSGGIYGFVRGIGDEELELEVAQGTVVRVSKRAVAVVLEPRAEDTPRTASEGEEDG